MQYGNNKALWDELVELANEFYARQYDFEKITEILLEKHNDEAMVYAVVKKVKSDHYAKHRKEGLVILGIGLVVILAGFLITCFNFHSNKSFTMAMYGLTSLGLVIVFVGLYKIVG
ncbi:MAG: hypothetical protein IPJ32_00520 [Sphingobacteriaceae bacterium]|nr:hypothetical protein [Sphingobacteriaceae bacterium]